MHFVHENITSLSYITVFRITRRVKTTISKRIQNYNKCLFFYNLYVVAIVSDLWLSLVG